MSIGSNVRKYRFLKSLSENELAEKCDISQGIISNLESDKNIPNSLMLNRIAKELDVDINKLLKDDSIVQNNYGKAVVHSQVTINNNFPEEALSVLLSNQAKITSLIETQNKLLETLLNK